MGSELPSSHSYGDEQQQAIAADIASEDATTDIAVSTRATMSFTSFLEWISRPESDRSESFRAGARARDRELPQPRSPGR